MFTGQSKVRDFQFQTGKFRRNYDIKVREKGFSKKLIVDRRLKSCNLFKRLIQFLEYSFHGIINTSGLLQSKWSLNPVWLAINHNTSVTYGE